MENNFRITFQKAILAGIAISLGGCAYLQVGGIIGAVLFAFGLLTCVHFGLSLFTGLSGFVFDKNTIIDLFVTLLGNIVGGALVGLAIQTVNADMSFKACEIMSTHINYEWYQALILSIFCGFIMTVSIYYGRRKLFLPLLFGVPLFIMCGFIHSIADAFYIFTCPFEFISNNILNIISYYLIFVIGNFIGCNLYRIIMLKLDYGD